MATKNEVAKVDPSALVVPDDIDIFGDAGTGNEAVGRDDIIIPRLQIVQALSDEHKPKKAKYIEGAEEGSVFNTATRRLYDQPLIIVPVAYRRRYIEWVPRAKGGGLVDPTHDESIMNKTVVNEQGSFMLDNGNEIVDTPENYVLVVVGDQYEQAVMSMAGSKARIARRWNTMIKDLRIKNPQTGKMINPGRFYGAYEFKTVMEENDRGDYYNWDFKYAGPTLALPDIGAEVYRACRAFHQLIDEEKVTAEIEDPKETTKTTDAF
jgi:hypothetical protein